MPKTPSDKLYRLIHSLSGSEKRYFKIYAAGAERRSNKYLLLFDAIDTQESFDEEALKKAVYGDEPIQSRKYSELKGYLYDLILKSLLDYDERSMPQFRLATELQHVHVLFRRGFTEEARATTLKIKKAARQQEHFNTALECLRWEKHLSYAQTDIAYLDNNLARIEQEERECLSLLDQIVTYRNIFLRLLTDLRKDATDGSSWLNHPLMADPQAPGSHTARVLFHRIRSLYLFAQKDFEKFHESSRQLLGLMESRPDLLREDLSEYISALSNFTLSCGWLKRYDEVEECLSKFRSIEPNTLDDEVKIHRQYYMNRFGLCIARGDFDAGRKAVEAHQVEMQRFPEHLFRKNTFFFQYFYIYFGAGDFDQALQYLNEWLSMSGNIERKDLQSLARILNLIIHFEMDNTLLLESLVRSTQRYMRKQKKNLAYEEIMVRFFKAAPRARTREELKDALRRLDQELAPLFNDTKEKPMLELFDIRAWVGSKLNQQSFGAAIRQRTY